MKKVIDLLMEAKNTNQKVLMTIKCKKAIFCDITFGVLQVETLENMLIINTDNESIPILTLKTCKHIAKNKGKCKLIYDKCSILICLE